MKAALPFSRPRKRTSSNTSSPVISARLVSLVTWMVMVITCDSPDGDEAEGRRHRQPRLVHAGAVAHLLERPLRHRGAGVGDGAAPSQLRVEQHAAEVDGGGRDVDLGHGLVLPLVQLRQQLLHQLGAHGLQLVGHHHLGLHAVEAEHRLVVAGVELRPVVHLALDALTGPLDAVAPRGQPLLLVLPLLVLVGARLVLVGGWEEERRLVEGGEGAGLAVLLLLQQLVTDVQRRPVALLDLRVQRTLTDTKQPREEPEQ